MSAVAAADPGSTLPAGWQHGAFIEVFVRSYQDSNGDGMGDLQGLISRLDYLKALGVKGIWVMPITKSQDGDHGYAVVDYRDVETAYGSLADLDQLLVQAHARGIGVILDYVMNHSGSNNPLFVNSAAASTNPYRNWYVWQAQDPGNWSVYGQDPWHLWPATGNYYYGAFSYTMPDFNLLNADTVEYHKNNLRFWLNRGVDGFRFDAVGNLVENGPTAYLDQPQNYTLMAGMRSLLNGYANRYMVCEAPNDPQGFGAATACGSAFTFDLNGSIAQAASGNTSAIQAVSNYFKTAPAGMAPFASNHDSFAGQRLWDQLGGNLVQYKLAAATYLLLPGTPFIYYGEEIGMAGAASLSGDPKLRTPMSWTSDSTTAGFTTGTPYRALSANVSTQNAAAQLADPNSLLAFYKAMLALRNSRPSIAQGSYDSPFVSGQVMGYLRTFATTTGSERSLVLINYGSTATTTNFGGLAANGQLTALYPAGGGTVSADAGGNASISVAAQSVQVYSVQ